MAKLSQQDAERGEESPRFSFPLAPARQRLLAWFEHNPASHPWRLDFQRTRDPYFVWISEIMLQQTVIKAVLPVYARFVRQFPNIESLAGATEQELRAAVRGLGYYRRFNLLHRAAQELVSAGRPVRWPATFADWKELPGVGDYTAAAVSSIAFNYPAAAVDGNVDRVVARLAGIRDPLIPGPVKKQIAALANDLLDRKRPGRFNEAMMELGQTICRPTSPHCGECPLATECVANEKQLTAAIPAPKPKMQYIDVTLRLLVAVREDRLFLHRRPDQAKFLRGTDGFATEIVTDQTSLQDGGNRTLIPEQATHLGTIKHSITKHKIVAEVYHCETPPEHLFGEWLDHSLVDERLISNLDRKAFRLWKKKKPTSSDVGLFPSYVDA